MAKDAGTKIIIYMSTKDGALTAAMPMVNGSLIQLFLTSQPKFIPATNALQE